MPNLEDLLLDPEPLDENDKSMWPEFFSIHQALGSGPGDLPKATPEFRDAYAEWLKESQNGKE